MNEELYLIIKAFFSIGVNLGESKGAISKKGNRLLNDYKQIQLHESKYIYCDSNEMVGNELNQRLFKQLDYPNENSCYLNTNLEDNLEEIYSIALSNAKTMKKDMKDKRSKEIIITQLYKVAVDMADELNTNLLESTFDLNEENILNAIEGKQSIVEIRQIIETIYTKHIIIQTKKYIENKLSFIQQLKNNNYTKSMLKLLEKEIKEIEKVKTLLSLVTTRESYELSIIKLYACYSVDTIIEEQREILTKSQVRKLTNFAKSVKKDINNKKIDTRESVTKIHNSMIRKNYS